ncbi:MAG: outer membrane lipoprotein carrier protein LolA [Alphaproteobacteria bacterium]|nr:outer membrane lipoprotein carrier protein LolA [Alphaproteobacteria bacterium]
MGILRRTVLAGLAALPATLAATVDAVAQSRGQLQPARLSDADRADLGRIETYLNSIRSAEARFLQIAQGGGTAAGRFSLARPGRLRFQYDPPAQVVMVSDGSQLLYHDAATREQTVVFLSQTPLGALAADRVRLEGGDLVLTKFERFAAAFALTLRQRSDPAQGEITLVFSDRPLLLQGWTVIDAQQSATRIALTELRANTPVDANAYDLGPFVLERMRDQRRD